MTRITKSFMGMGAYEAHFVSRPHLLDLFNGSGPGGCLAFYDGEEWWFTGPITEPARIEGGLIVVSGPGLEWLLGEDDKKGRVRSPRDYNNQTTDQIIQNALLDDVGVATLLPGNIQPGNNVVLFSIFYETQRRIIRRVAAMTRTEYKINPDFTFDWPGNTNGGKIGTVKNIILAKAARTAKEVEYEPTTFDVADKIIVLARGANESMLVRTATGAFPAGWKDPFNNNFHREMVIDAPNANTQEEADFVAAAQLGLRSKIFRRAKVELKNARLRREFDIGDSLYVYKPMVLEDEANAVPYKSRIFPGLLMRVSDIEVECGPEWRCFYRSPTGVFTELTALNVKDEYTSVSVVLSSDPEQFFNDINDADLSSTDERREDQTDQTIPSAPAGLTISSATYKDYAKHQRARLTFQWTAVTLNTDGSTITDLSRYVVRFRRVTGVSTDPWQTVEAPVGTVKASAENLPVGVTWEAQVAAEDESGNRSAWAPVTPVNTLAAVDTTPPPQPKTPVATGGIGVVYVEWDRKDATNVDMPADVRWYEVHASTTSGFTPSTGTLQGTTEGTLASFDAAAGTWYVKLIAVDFAGNKSIASAQDDATAAALTGIPPGSVTGQEIADGAISTDKTVFGDFYNLNDDPSFEFSVAGTLNFPRNDDQFWAEGAASQIAPWEIVTGDPTNSRTGKAYAKRVGNASDPDAYLYAVNRMPCRPGDEFFVEEYFKTSGTPNGTIHLGMRWLDGNEAALSITDAATSTADPTSYTVLQGKVTAPASAAWCEWVCYVTSHTTGTYFVDDTFCLKSIIAVYISSLAAITALIADLSVGTGHIANLIVGTAELDIAEINTAQVLELIANNILAGDIEVTLTLTSGLIRTDDTGARVEITNSGLDFFAPSSLGGFSGTVIDWWRDGQGDASHWARLAAGWDASLCISWWEAQAKSSSHKGILIAQVIDHTGSIEQRITLDESNSWMILDADYAGGTRGRLVLHKGVQSTGFTAEFDLNDSVLKVGDEGMIYSNAKYHAFNSVAANAKPTPASIGYDDSFNANCAVPYPWLSIGNESNAMASASAAAIGRGGFTLQLLNHAGSTQAYDVFILPIAAF